MSLGRLLLVLVLVGAGVWLVRSQHLLGPAKPDAARAAPVDRAREAARASGARNAQTEAATRDLDAPAPDGAITENMTPEQVRALLGPPDGVDSQTTDSGVALEKWSYRRVGKTVVFENGVVARIE